MKYLEFGNNAKLETNILMIDECHKLSDDQRQRIKDSYSNVKVIGLTATPKGKGLGEKIYSYKRQQAMNDGIISPFICDRLGEDYPGREDIQKSVDYQNSRFKFISNVDLFARHARANGIKCPGSSQKKLTTTTRGSFRKRFRKAVKEGLSDNNGLYHHQQKAIKKIAKFYYKGEGKVGLIEMATGSGKTRVQIELANLSFLAKSKKTCDNSRPKPKSGKAVLR